MLSVENALKHVFQRVEPQTNTGYHVLVNAKLVNIGKLFKITTLMVKKLQEDLMVVRDSNDGKRF